MIRPTERRYTYLGDKWTAPALRGAHCRAVLRPDGRCITGRGSMAVLFDGETVRRVVIRRLLRKLV